jgi:hypothetical protein
MQLKRNFTEFQPKNFEEYITDLKYIHTSKSPHLITEWVSNEVSAKVLLSKIMPQ